MKRTATFFFLIFRTVLYNFILFKFAVETKLFEARAYCLQANFFQIIYFGLCSVENISIFKLIRKLVRKFSTELTELVGLNQQIIFMKTTFECVVDYLMDF